MNVFFGGPVTHATASLLAKAASLRMHEDVKGMGGPTFVVGCAA